MKLICLKIIVLSILFSCCGLQGQVRYDTSVIITKPCTVKKISFKYDTSKYDPYSEKKWSCSIYLNWPHFENCANGKIDSVIADKFKSKLKDKVIKGRSYYTVCEEEREQIVTDFSIDRFDSSILNGTFKYSYSDKLSVDIYTKFFNYDFNHHRFLKFRDVFYQNSKGSIRKLVNQKLDTSYIGKGAPSIENFKIQKQNIIIKPYLTVGYSLKIDKTEIKKFLKKKYYVR